MPQAAAIPKADPTAPRGPRGQPSQLPPSHNEPAPAPKTFLRANRRSPTPSITPKPLDNGMCRRSGAIKRQPFPSRGQGRISPLGGTRRGSDPNSQGPTTRRAQLLRSEMAGAGPMDNSWRTLTLPHPLPGADFSSLLFFCSDRKQSYSIAHDIGTLSREASQSLTSATQLQQLPHYRDLRRGMGARAGDRYPPPSYGCPQAEIPPLFAHLRCRTACRCWHPSCRLHAHRRSPPPTISRRRRLPCPSCNPRDPPHSARARLWLGFPSSSSLLRSLPPRSSGSPLQPLVAGQGNRAQPPIADFC